MLRIRLLGGLEVEADGRAIEAPPGRPAQSLLAWLALNPGMHARSRVAAALWPDVLDDSARMSLRSALTALRRALGDDADAIVATREQLGLAPDVWVDVRHFDELAAAGRLGEAIALGRGDLLPGLDHDWVMEARDDRRARLAEAVGRHADADEERGDLDAAVRRSRELVALDPLSEDAHRALMRRLAASGDRAAALVVFERLRERLRGELGVVPAPETRELAESIRREESAPTPGAVAAEPPPLPAAVVRRRRSAFVGRGEELERLRASWDLACGGERQLVVVFGEPGVGKSRLAAELARGVHADGAVVLLGRCTEEPLLPYQPFAEALRPSVAAAAPDQRMGELTRLFPELADRAGTGWAPPRDAEGARFLLFEAVDSLLASMSAQRPVLLVLEDLHWADRPTLLLMRHVVAAHEPARLLVLGTYRETELRWAGPLAATLAELRRERIGARLRLDGLAVRDVAALLESWDGRGTPRDFPAQVHHRTGGNPFFVEEVLMHLAETGEAREAGVPEGVKEVVGRRVERLAESTRRVLGVGAVLGRRFDLHLLGAVVDDVPAGELADALGEAVDAGLVREEPERAGGFAFSHALVRETLYERLPAARRATLHSTAAEALEHLYGQRPDRIGEIAHHLFQAAAPPLAERGIAYAVKAAELALEQLAYEEAAYQLERALRAGEFVEHLDGPTRCGLLLRLGDARMRAGDRAGGRTAFAEAANAARSAGRTDLLARAALGFGGLGVTILEVDTGVVTLLEEALEGLDGDDDALRARLLARLAVELYYGPSRERSEALGAEALDAARSSGDERTLAYALNARHVSVWRPDRLDERLAIAQEMVALATATGDREGELQARNWLVADLFEAGRMEELDAAIESHDRLARELRLPAFEWCAPLWRGALSALRGELTAMEPLLREAQALAGRAGDPNVELADQVRLTAACMRGHFETAYELLAPMAEAKIGSSPASLSFRCGMAFLTARMGRIDEAGEHFRLIAAEGFDRLPVDVNWLETVGILGETCALLGDAERAERLYELLGPYERRLEAIAGRALASWGSAARHLGVVATARSSFEDAERHFEMAVAENERLGFRPWLAWTRYQYAEMLLRRDAPGDRERARTALDEAARLAAELDLGGLGRLIAHLAEADARPASR